MRLRLHMGLLVLLVGGCSTDAPTAEELARLACVSAVSERLGQGPVVDITESPAHRVMIGKRDYGWLVRGLTTPGADGQRRNFQCRAEAVTVPAKIEDVRLCAETASPWGCP